MTDLITSFVSSLFPGSSVGHPPGPGPYVYHERQIAALCGRHCLNNMLQGPYFDDFQLAEIAQELDAKERELMMALGTDTDDAVRFAAEESGNVDDGGNFSFSVLNEAIHRSHGLKMVNVGAEGETVLETPETEHAFVCNLDNHWFVIRKLYGRWFNLNSTLKKPQLISDFYLSVYLAQLRAEGYSIFAVRGDSPLPEPIKDQGEAKNWHPLAALLDDADKQNHKGPTNNHSTSNHHGGDFDSDLEAAIAASLSDSTPGSHLMPTVQPPPTTITSSSHHVVDLSGTGGVDDEDEDLKLALAISMSTQPTPSGVPPSSTTIDLTTVTTTTTTTTTTTVPIPTAPTVTQPVTTAVTQPRPIVHSATSQLPPEPDLSTDNTATVKLRLPPKAGSASLAVVVYQRRFNGSDSGDVLFQWIDILLPDEHKGSNYHVTIPSNGQKYSRADASGLTMEGLGFVPNVVMMVRYD